MQTKCRTTSLLDCYAEVYLVLCKGKTKHLHKRMIAWWLYEMSGILYEIFLFTHWPDCTHCQYWFVLQIRVFFIETQVIGIAVVCFAWAYTLPFNLKISSHTFLLGLLHHTESKVFKDTVVTILNCETCCCRGILSIGRKRICLCSSCSIIDNC